MIYALSTQSTATAIDNEPIFELRKQISDFSDFCFLISEPYRRNDNMKIMVIGGGGREHAIIKKLLENAKVEKIYCLPGNGGIAADAECVAIGSTDIPAIVDFASKNGIDYAVVAQDDPLILGCVDELNKIGVPCFGPDKKAAIIEGSKVFSKNFMKKYGIPTAEYEVFEDAKKAIEYVKTCKIPTVVKADGPALGKGALVCMTRNEALLAVKEIMENKKFGTSGDKILIEEFMTGPEVSVLAFTDGETVIPMVSSTDHKRAHDGDEGLNTGGMGTIAPSPYYTKEVEKAALERIIYPTVKAMKAEGRPFKGCLYFGLMITSEGPKVVEYNCRFGDPETQVVLPLLCSDLLDIMLATTNGNLKDVPVEFSSDSACCVIMASDGYPEKYEKGFEITIPEDLKNKVYFAGAKLSDGRLLSNGGRVLGVVGKGKDLSEAVKTAYSYAERISFKNAYYRRDIGKKALLAFKEG